MELAVEATILIFAACVSFGAGAVAGAAKTAHTISKFAKIIRSAVSTWKVSKRISEGVKKAPDIAGVRKRLERIKSLGRRAKREEPKPPVPASILADLFQAGRVPKASELEDYALGQGWTKLQSPTGPAKYVDENDVVRMTIKHGSPHTPGSELPHVELHDAVGQRIDPFGNSVTRRSDGNHTPIEWDW